MAPALMIVDSGFYGVGCRGGVSHFGLLCTSCASRPEVTDLTERPASPLEPPREKGQAVWRTLIYATCPLTQLVLDDFPLYAAMADRAMVKKRRW